MASSSFGLKHHHIDLDLFVRLYDDLSIFPAVAGAFARMVRNLRAEVRDELVHSDVQALSASLHKMKGCCAMMGAVDLAEDIGQLESALKHSDIAVNVPLLKEVLCNIGEMEEEVNKIASNFQGAESIIKCDTQSGCSQ
ncbi:Hpt domain-containing protein [Hydrogenophaga sp.]|uniref:Hpt domain-containing protein n=1 Tax=Hydrogenophaga sp. TaxID=1904254 RepID=UPI00286D8E6C|nr:Hpt domain-containing protein [Hydrogenophaga sp.]